jgi:hypothetical protein
VQAKKKRVSAGQKTSSKTGVQLRASVHAEKQCTLGAH